jgi:hypothetical protein
MYRVAAMSEAEILAKRRSLIALAEELNVGTAKLFKQLLDPGMKALR